VQHKLQLSYLCLGGFCITDTAAAAVATITGLRELELHNAPELTPYGIKHLTELQQLTRLTLDAVGLKRGIECFIMPNSTMVSCAAYRQAKSVEACPGSQVTMDSCSRALRPLQDDN
jgi:hypothetical protein